MLLLKDLGCSSDAARICQLFATSDHDFKRSVKLVDSSLPQVLRFIAQNTAVKSGLAERLRTILKVAAVGGKIDRELTETHCHRGANICPSDVIFRRRGSRHSGSGRTLGWLRAATSPQGCRFYSLRPPMSST